MLLPKSRIPDLGGQKHRQCSCCLMSRTTQLGIALLLITANIKYGSQRISVSPVEVKWDKMHWNSPIINTTFYKILNNIIKISPGLLTRSHNRRHYIVPRSRLNTVVYSFYPRAIRIWNTIPKEITENKQPESLQAAISKLPFTTPTHLKCL